MNREELEKWMKDSLDKEEFIPREAGWDKLKAALPVTNDRRKTFIFLLPQKLKIAASLLLLVAAGSLVYFMGRDTKHKISSGTIARTQPSLASASKKTEAALITGSAQTMNEDHPANPYPHTNKRSTNSPLQLTDPALYTAVAQPGSIAAADSPAEKIIVYTPPEKNILSDPDVPAPRYSMESAGSPALNFGVAAQFGKANVGNMRYQLGVVAHQKISRKFYAEATIALASTEVSYVQKSSYPSVTIGSFANNIGSKSIDAQYGSNILSAGIAPSIGYRITPKLALGCGMALYRNLNPSLTLQNDAEIEQAALSNNLVSETNSVSNWDAGLTGNAACNIGSRLTINIQYRHGLSTFMYFNNQAVRNSGFNMGLKYLFEK